MRIRIKRPPSSPKRGYKHRACLRTVRLPAGCGRPGGCQSASPVWRRSWLNIMRRTYRHFSGRCPCRILCLFVFCPFHELLSVETETRVHHDTLLYHNFAYFSISFGFFGAHQNRWVSSSNCHPPFDKLLKCPAFYQFLGANIENTGAVRLFQEFINLPGFRGCPSRWWERL